MKGLVQFVLLIGFHLSWGAFNPLVLTPELCNAVIKTVPWACSSTKSDKKELSMVMADEAEEKSSSLTDVRNEALARSILSAMSCGLITRVWNRCVSNYGAGDQLLNTPEESEKWSYRDVNAWIRVSSFCAGNSQSPIAIRHDQVLTLDYPQFSFGNYDKLFPLDITNDGNTVRLALKDALSEHQSPFFIGGGLKDRYQFAQAHIHWGSSIGRGSEHTSNSTAFEAEIHLVHYNSRYVNFDEAVKHSDGVAVLGVLVKQAEETSLDLGPLQRLDQYFSANNHLPKTVSIPDDVSIPIERLLPQNLQNFYRYSGSLTTPPCSEVVTWTVFAKPITFSSQQMDGLRSLKNTFGEPLVNNYRPIQPLKNRIVTYSQPI